MRFLVILLLSISLGISEDFIKITYGIKDCKNFKQKDGGTSYSFYAERNLENGIIDIKYLKMVDETLKPPMPKDIKVDKTSLKYRLNLNQKFQIGVSYINVQDNFMPTDNGNIFGISGLYKFKPFFTGLAYYHSEYDDFQVEQVDYFIGKKSKKYKIKLIAKANFINDYSNKIFMPMSKAPEPDDQFLTFGIMGKYNLPKMFFGEIGIFKGERLFTVMENGLSVQHHPMKIDNSYSVSLGKKIKNIIRLWNESIR